MNDANLNDPNRDTPSADDAHVRGPNDAHDDLPTYDLPAHDAPTHEVPLAGRSEHPAHDGTTEVRGPAASDRTEGTTDAPHADRARPVASPAPPVAPQFATAQSSTTPAIAAWRRPTSVALLLALLAALTFAAVSVVVRSRHDDRATPAVSSPGVAASAPPSGTSASTSSTSHASSATAPTASRPAPVTVTATDPTHAPVAPAQPTPAPDQAAAAPTDTAATDSHSSSSTSSSDTTSPDPSASASPSLTSPGATAVPGDDDFPPSTGSHCVTESGGVTSTTATDVRQALTRQSSCALLLTVRDAVHARTAANPTASSYSLRAFSAYRKRQEPTTDGFIDLTCTRTGRFVTCTSVHPPVEIWVRDAS